MASSPAKYPRRGEVYDVNFDPVVGSEIGKRRPGVIVSNDVNNRYSNTVTVVPITSAPARRHYPFEVRFDHRVAGLRPGSRAKCDQVRTVDKRRLAVVRGVLTDEYVVQLDRGLMVHLGLYP